jgi:hypothetical protein
MKRRTFIKRGALFVPMVFVPKIARAALDYDLGSMLSQQKPAAAGSLTLSMITNQSSLSARANLSGVVGTKFVANANVTVTALGAYIDAGGSQTHHVGIWNSGGTLLASVSIAFTGLSGYNYVSISSTSLTSGLTYVLGEEQFSGGDSWYDDTSVLTVSPDFSLTTSIYTDGAWPTEPTISHTAGKSYGFPTFQYTKP